LFTNSLYHNQKTAQKFFLIFWAKQMSRQNFFENRVGGEPHAGRARSARRTAKTMAIFENRRRKNRKSFGRFDLGSNIQPSSNFFPKFGLASARKFLQNLCSKTEKFSLHFFDFCARPIFFKKEKKIFCFGFFRRKKAESGNSFVSLYIFGRP